MTPKCSNCGLSPAKEGALCWACAKADRRARRTPGEVVRDRERERARKAIHGQGIVAKRRLRPRVHDDQERLVL
jgi:hypothetical protein